MGWRLVPLNGRTMGSFPGGAVGHRSSYPPRQDRRAVGHCPDSAFSAFDAPYITGQVIAVDGGRSVNLQFVLHFAPAVRILVGL